MDKDFKVLPWVRVIPTVFWLVDIDPRSGTPYGYGFGYTEGDGDGWGIGNQHEMFRHDGIGGGPHYGGRG